MKATTARASESAHGGASPCSGQRRRKQFELYEKTAGGSARNIYVITWRSRHAFMPPQHGNTHQSVGLRDARGLVVDSSSVPFSTPRYMVRPRSSMTQKHGYPRSINDTVRRKYAYGRNASPHNIFEKMPNELASYKRTEASDGTAPLRLRSVETKCR